MVWDSGMKCHGAGLFFLRSMGVGVFAVVGVLFPLVLR
jgi:hypothetical protein